MLDWFEEDDRMNSQLSEDLFKFIFRETLSESQARGLMYQALLGAKHCLDRGVIHRDIKLDNDVINSATKQVKLINFVCGEIIKRVEQCVQDGLQSGPSVTSKPSVWSRADPQPVAQSNFLKPGKKIKLQAPLSAFPR